jgi:hypothetical protein
MRSIGRPELATLVLAVVRGLIMDLEATGDASRADQAFDDFLATLAPITTRDSAPRVEGSRLPMPPAGAG